MRDKMKDTLYLEEKIQKMQKTATGLQKMIKTCEHNQDTSTAQQLEKMLSTTQQAIKQNKKYLTKQQDLSEKTKNT